MKEGSSCIWLTFTLLNHNGVLPCYDDGDDDDDHGGDDQNDGDQIVPRYRGYHASGIMTCNTNQYNVLFTIKSGKSRGDVYWMGIN